MSYFIKCVHGRCPVPEKEYPLLSSESNPTDSIKKQEEMNVEASRLKQEVASNTEKLKKNRNMKREGSARQPKSIPLLTWGPLFACYYKDCAYQQCNECGIDRFFNETNNGPHVNKGMLFG